MQRILPLIKQSSYVKKIVKIRGYFHIRRDRAMEDKRNKDNFKSRAFQILSRFVNDRKLFNPTVNTTSKSR